MRDKVKEGYEKGDYEGEYREEREIREKEKELFEKLFNRISGKNILDLGCGTGEPFDRFLADQGYKITGIDISEKHVERARENVPEGEFAEDTFLEAEFENREFDGIVSFYAIFHIPREEQKKVLENIYSWLKDDGAILITLGAEEMETYEENIGGGELAWSSYTSDKNVKMVENSGFEIIETYIEDWRDESHLWILAKKESSS